MSWRIKIDNINNVARNQVAPVFSFVEDAVKNGICYRVGDDGYFVVAPEKSLTPRFIVELRLPSLAEPELYKSLTFEMANVSSGMLWLDDKNYEAQDFCWRMRLPLRLGSPLLAWNENCVVLPLPEGAIIEQANIDDHSSTVSLLTSFDFHLGGQTKEMAELHLNQGKLRVLKYGNEVLGVTLLEPQASNYVSVTVVLAKQIRNKGIGKAFLSNVAKNLLDEGKIAVVGMSDHVVASYKGAISLGMEQVKRGFIAHITEM